MFKTLIDPSTLAPKLRDPNWVVIDCRFDLTNVEKGEALYREAHIPGAANYFFQQNLTAEKTFKEPDDLKTQWAAILKGHDPRDVVVYCGSGVTACHNLLALEHAGIHGVKIYPGSWSEYSSDATRPKATTED
jgi:thiosulfate/3-mercaptopyruvate sulfurtransferase